MPKAGNWEKLESGLRDIVKEKQQDVEVYTGQTILRNISSYRLSYIEFDLFPHTKVSEPSFFPTLLKRKSSVAGIPRYYSTQNSS